MKQSNKRHGLRFKWMFRSLSLLIAILLVAVSIINVVISNQLHNTLRADLVSRVSAASGFFSKYANSGYEELYAGAKRYVEGYADKNLVELQILEPSGRIMFSTSGLASGMLPTTRDLEDALNLNTIASWSGINPSSGEKIMAVSGPIVFPSGEVAAIVRCVCSLQQVTSQSLMYLGLSLLIAFAIVLLFIFTNLFFLRSILTPIAKINDTAMEIAEGRYGVHIDELYAGEIGELCDTINNMSDAISRAESTKNDFISSLSHELRTPLTAIAGWSETLLGGGFEDIATFKRGLEIIKNEASRLTRMVEELLDFSRMESGALRMQMERVDIQPDIEEVVFMYMETLHKEGIKLEFNEDDELPLINGDRSRLRQVFFNILDNARKHGVDGKVITVSATANESTIEITVSDYGMGIAPEELPYVKDKFYKGSSNKRGSGIGLAVADEIMRLHGGNLDISSVYGEGTTVTLSLPILKGIPH